VSQDVIGTINPNSSGTGFTVDPVNLPADDTFINGATKDILGVGGWQWRQHTVQDKDDIAHAFGSAVSDGASGHQLLFGGLDRFAANGADPIGSWFLQTS